LLVFDECHRAKNFQVRTGENHQPRHLQPRIVPLALLHAPTLGP
jgi:hypothetical protein